MSTATIEKGSKVQVTVTGTVIGKGSSYTDLRLPSGETATVPNLDAENVQATKLRDPLPTEPTKGSLVRSVMTGAIYRRGVYGWERQSNNGQAGTHSWDKLNDLHDAGLELLTPSPLDGKAPRINGDWFSIKATSGIYNDATTFKATRYSDGPIKFVVGGASAKVSAAEAQKLARAILAN